MMQACQKGQDLLAELEVGEEAPLCEFLGSLPWPVRPLQMEGACCSVLD